MKKYLSILLFVVAFSACDEVERTIYNGGEGDRTFLAFSSNVYDLPVTIDQTGSVDVTLSSSTVSSVDRTYAISVVADESTANPAVYNLPSTVTIPAGEHLGVFTITAQDNNMVETTAQNLVIQFTPLNESEDSDSTQATVSIFQVCPLNEGTFLGSYLMEQISAINPDDGGVPVFEPQVVTITQANPEVPTSRQFSAIYLEGLGIGQPAATVRFNLACLDVIASADIDTFLTCDQVSNITLGPGTTPGSYDTEDDTEFTLTVTEYASDGGCGAAPYQVTFKFTKQ
ncbi:MAG TPA: hypothetical protein VGB44_07565 [Flavobacterium sp.]|jgi:hypothetical protein